MTEKVRRRPYCVILFDEIEKAHPDVFNIMLQVLEDGTLTDAQGRKVDFKNSIIVMTSNVGARNILSGKKMGFQAGSGEVSSLTDIRTPVMEELKRTFRPEFLNRIDEVIVFHQLDRQHIRIIAGNMLKKVADQISKLKITVKWEDSILDYLAEKGFDPAYGARPLRRVIQSTIEDIIAEKVLEGTLTEGGTAQLILKNGKPVIISQ